MSEADFAHAATFYAAGHYAIAVAAYNTIATAPAASDEVKARALNNISACYAALRDYPNALRTALEVIAMQPRNAKALGRAATAQEGLKRYEAAMDFFTQAAAIDKTNAAYSNGVQRCWDLIEARRGLATAEGRDSYYYTKSVETATAAMKSSNFLEAIRHFGKALDRLPATATAREKATLLSNRSAAYFRAKRMEESADDALAATRADNNYARAFFRLGAAKAELKKAADAFDALARCIELEPGHTEAIALRAVVAPAALEAFKTSAERAREHAERVADISRKMQEEQAARSAAAMPQVAAARSSGYAYCSYCNETGHARAECPLLRRKRFRSD